MALKELWVEKHRPNTLSKIIFGSERERAFFEKIVEERSIPNLLLVGVQGTGKTSLSGALINDIGVLPEDTLRVNCSDEKIEAIREKVKTFAYTMPLGEFKVCQLEEMDNLSHDAQKLLRALMEEVSSSCRFIATGNYANKILPAMHSRFQTFTFAKPNRDEVLLQAADILVAEGIDFDVEDLEKVVAAGYPDVRKVIQLLEVGSKSGRLLLSGGEDGVADWKLQLFPFLESGDFKGARKLVCESASREELQDVYRFLYENLHRIKKLKGKEDQAVILIAQYAYQHAFVADVEIQVAALFIELGALN